jgi:hypothetical protein
MPASKKYLRDRNARLNGHLPSPRKAIKRVAAIGLSPVKHIQKKHRNAEPEDGVVCTFFPSRSCLFTLDH